MKRILQWCIVLVLLLSSALADTSVWLESVTVIEESMFEDDVSLERLTVPEGVTTIGRRAFANSGLVMISLPESLTEIGAEAFAGVGPVKVHAVSGSYAAQYARDNLELTQTTYKAGTYMIGSAMSAGTYIIKPSGTSKATVTLYSTTASKLITDQSFTGNAIITVQKGERLTLTACTAVLDYEFDNRSNLDVYGNDPMLRVGQDLPAGTYTVVQCASAATAYAYVYGNARYQRVSVQSGFSSCDVTVQEGQILCLRNARITKCDGMTAYRAYLVGNTYSNNSLHSLGTGPVNDVNAIKGMLGTMSATPYRITTAKDVTKSGILNGIRNTFAEADDDDISLFFYSGHGMQGGKLVGNDLASLSPSELRRTMDEIPGKKIVLVDACYSGALIQKSAVMLLGASDSAEGVESTAMNGEESSTGTTQAEVDSFASSLVSAF